MEKTSVDIGGMHCASCAATIEKSLKKVEGVKEASGQPMKRTSVT